jgi:hypothetical protein
VTIAGLAAATGQARQTNTLRIATASDDEQTRSAVAEAVTKKLDSAGIEVEGAESTGEQEDSAIMGSVVGNTFMSAPLPFQISALGVGIWSVIVVLGAVLPTAAAATRASQLTVREALTYV